ncbi:alpha/beta hydrolase [Faecalimicrobium sp. JNUCC 81]
MRGKVVNYNILGREILIYLPKSYDENNHGKKYPVIYIHDGDKVLNILDKIMFNVEKYALENKCEEHIIVGIVPINRLDEYTPWPESSLVEKFKPFKGKGEEYLDFIVDNLKPCIDSKFNTKEYAKNTSMIGYSLGGLISLFSIYKHGSFGNIVSICGSQWYRGWIDFMQKNNIKNKDINILIIAGLREGENKLTIQKYIKEYVEKSYSIFTSQIGKTNVSLEWDDYGHNENVIARYEKAIKHIYNLNKITI